MSLLGLVPVTTSLAGNSGKLHGGWQTAGVVFVADALGGWLVGQLADAGRKKLTELVLGSEQERALRRAADAAVWAAAEELSPSGQQLRHPSRHQPRALHTALSERRQLLRIPHIIQHQQPTRPGIQQRAQPCPGQLRIGERGLLAKTSLITSLTLAAIAAAPRTSRPTVTQYTRPPNCRRTRRSAHTIRARVVFPNPPAPYNPVVIPTVPACPPTSARTTADSSAGRFTTQFGTASSGGSGTLDGRGTNTQCRGRRHHARQCRHHSSPYRCLG